MNRREAFGGVSILALVACTPSASGNANSQAVFAQIQYILPMVRVLAAGIAIAEPKAAGIVAQVAPYLDQAGAAFQNLSATMTEVQALPIVQQVAGYAKSAVDAVAAVVEAAAPGSKLAQYAPMVAEAQAVLALITAFAVGVQNAPKAAARPMALPLLHK
jgi:hypothetical protein